ncbi:MAG: putative glycoside hydrolase [Gemmatimonadota bacterium]|nr:putative glycoside hydrolase [Gemmatimonadota bacterium]
MMTSASAQSVDGTWWLSPPSHSDSLPDYIIEMLVDPSQRLALPPPPAAQARIPNVHHDDHLPNYQSGFRSQSVSAITIPPPPRGQPPAALKGLYANGWLFGSDRLYRLIALVDTTEINALVIDVKDATGFLTYRSSVATAEEIGANGLIRTRDPRSRLALLEQHGIHAVARIVVARDPLLARHKPDWAIQDATTGALWRDGLGEPWVDAFNDSVWIYAADLAAEAVLLGFKEIQFDYVRFPDEPPSRLNRTVYPARRAGESRRAAIRRNINLLRNRVNALGVPFTLDVFGLTTTATGDLGIGQVWDDLSSAADVILPMVYPSHYRRGSYGIAHPNAQPYEIVRRALEEAIVRSRRLDRPARIRPYLQAFTIYRVRYGPEEIRAQIRAVEDLGLTDWVLWNARGVYPPAALRPAPLPAGVTGTNGGGDDRVDPQTIAPPPTPRQD